MARAEEQQQVEPGELPWLRRRYAEVAEVADETIACLLAAIAAAELTAPDHVDLVQRSVEAIPDAPSIDGAVLIEPSEEGDRWIVGAAAGGVQVARGLAIAERGLGEMPLREAQPSLDTPLFPPGKLTARSLLGPGVGSAHVAWIERFEQSAALLVVGSSGADDQGVAIVEAAAAALGLAIQRRGAEARFRELTRTLQEGLMPPLRLEIPGLQFAARLVTPGAGVLIGGDFCDVFKTGDGGWAFLIGDVAGHGFELATASALARYTVRVAALEDSRPATVLTRLDETIGHFRPEDQFCTAAYLKFSPVGSAGSIPQATLGIIGHPPPLRAAGGEQRVEVLEPQPGLLGVEGELRPEEIPIEPRSGDVFVLYTDGVTDAGRGGEAGEALGLDGLRAIVLESVGRGDDADGVAAAIEQAVLAAMAGQPNDDAAVVVIRVEASSRRS